MLLKYALLFVILVTISFGVSFGLYYYNNHGDTQKSMEFAEYISPYGFKFAYPEQYRLARDYTQFSFSIGTTTPLDPKDLILLLTSATPKEESAAIEKVKFAYKELGVTDIHSEAALKLAPFGPPEFAPQKTIVIQVGSSGFSDEQFEKFASTTLNKTFIDKFGYLPVEVIKFNEIATKNGMSGAKFIIRSRNGESIVASIDAQFKLNKTIASPFFPDEELKYLIFRIPEDSSQNLKDAFNKIVATVELI